VNSGITADGNLILDADLTLGGNANVNGTLIIGAATTLDVSNGNNYSVDVAGDWANSGTFTPQAGTVTFDGTAAQTLTGGTTFYNLTVNNSHATSKVDASGSTSLAVTNNLSITDGIFKSTSAYANVTIGTSGTLELSGDITVSGDWANSGTFTPGTHKVTLDGTGQTLTGATSFYQLTKNVTSADTLTCTSGTANKTTITNTLDLQGQSGKLLSLRSSSAGTQWEIDPQSTRTIAYLDVKDSNNVNATAINAAGTDSVDSGNNTNWYFGLASGTPATYNSSVTKVEMYNGTSWVTIFSGTAPLDVAAGGTFDGISDLTLPDGTYSQIRVTFNNAFPLEGSVDYGGKTYYTTAATFGGQTNLASTPTNEAGDMEAFTFRNPAWGALNADVAQTFDITPVTVDATTDYQPTLTFTISNALLFKGTAGTPASYYLTLGAPGVSLNEP
jgi:hypothetical protein